MADEYRFSGPLIVFHERPLPERATPVGYAALIDALQLRVPLPRVLRPSVNAIASAARADGASSPLGTLLRLIWKGI